MGGLLWVINNGFRIVFIKDWSESVNHDVTYPISFTIAPMVNLEPTYVGNTTPTFAMCRSPIRTRFNLFKEVARQEILITAIGY